MVVAGDVDLWDFACCFAKEFRAPTFSWVWWSHQIGFAWRPAAAVFLCRWWKIAVGSERVQSQGAASTDRDVARPARIEAGAKKTVVTSGTAAKTRVFRFSPLTLKNRTRGRKAGKAGEEGSSRKNSVESQRSKCFHRGLG